MTYTRTQTIRLAACEIPGSDERKHLLSSLRTAGREWAGSYEANNVRVRWKDHPWNYLEVQELPSKPVKRMLRQRIYNTMNIVQHLQNSGNPFLMTNLVDNARLVRRMDFDQVVRAMDESLEMAKKEVLTDEGYLQYPQVYHKYTESDIRALGYANIAYDRTINFLEVEPADYKPVKFKGRDFDGVSEWTSFTFYDAKNVNEAALYIDGMRAFYRSLSPGGARKLFQILKADPSVVENMTIDKFTALLDKSKIGYRYVPTVNR